VSKERHDKIAGVTPSRLWTTLITQGHDAESLDAIDAAILVSGWRPQVTLRPQRGPSLNLSEYVAYEGMHFTLNVTVFLRRQVTVKYCVTVGHPSDRHYGKRLIEPYRREYKTLAGLKRHLPKQVANLRSIARTHATLADLHKASKALAVWKDPDGSIASLVRERMSHALEDIATSTLTWHTST
jgi:hypothetical protein